MSLTISEAARSVFGQVAPHSLKSRCVVPVTTGSPRLSLLAHCASRCPMTTHSPEGGGQRYRTHEGCPQREPLTTVVVDVVDVVLVVGWCGCCGCGDFGGCGGC